MAMPHRALCRHIRRTKSRGTMQRLALPSLRRQCGLFALRMFVTSWPPNCGGIAHLELIFDPAAFALKQWTVIDAQGFQTVVTLFNVDLKTKPDPELFHIDEPMPKMIRNR